MHTLCRNVNSLWQRELLAVRQFNSGQDGKDPCAHDGGDERCGAGELFQGGDAEDPLRASLDQLGA